MRENGEERLNLYVSTLGSALGKFQYLPFIMSFNKDIVDLLVESGDTTLVNQELQVINARAGSDVIYILDRHGDTVASSNWRTDRSFVGKNYSFRPYFNEAMKGIQGGFFAIGVTTGEPGYFISAPIQQAGIIIGVAVVKVKLEKLQSDWANGGETVFVSDFNGIVFLSSKKPWKYTSLTVLSPEIERKIKAGRQYDGVTLQQLPIRHLSKRDTERIAIDGEPYLSQSRPLPGLGWTMYFLSPLRAAYDEVYNVVAWTASAAVFLIAILLLFRERRLKLINQKLAMEADVFRTLNRKLEAEVGKHQQTENELRAAQEEILQASKLAAMGQMSTAIAHELNQPITAIRTSVASSKKLLQLNHLDKVAATLDVINNLSVRLTALTTQLKTFARKNKGPVGLVNVGLAIQNALALFEQRIKEMGVTVKSESCDPSPKIVSDPIKIEQVFVNLISNALDAMMDCEDKHLSLCLKKETNIIRIEIADTGRGILEEDLGFLFDPFFTTKGFGDGVGLGLSIVFSIVKDMDGSVVASKKPGGEGTIFIVELPLRQVREEFSFGKNDDH